MTSAQLREEAELLAEKQQLEAEYLELEKDLQQLKEEDKTVPSGLRFFEPSHIRLLEDTACALHFAAKYGPQLVERMEKELTTFKKNTEIFRDARVVGKLSKILTKNLTAARMLRDTKDAFFPDETKKFVSKLEDIMRKYNIEMPPVDSSATPANQTGNEE